MCIVDSSLFAEKEPDMLTPFTVLMPANIRFGRGQAESAAPWLAQQGGPILLVHGASPQRAAFLRQQLEALQLAVTTLAISREPWLSDIEQGVQLAREKGIRAVVSLGGGAVIDAGKAIAALVPAASRDEMAWVSLCGGLALANAGLGVIHGLAGPLGGLSRASHGALCGSLLPFGLALNESQINDPGLRQRVNDVRRWLADGLDVPVDQVWDSLREWSHRAGLGTLRDLGVARDALEPAALAASTSSSMKANPVSLSGEQLLEMLEAAWE